jgi:hypothetical protein
VLAVEVLAVELTTQVLAAQVVVVLEGTLLAKEL